MTNANRPLNMQAIALEEAETKIRQVTKDEYFKQTPKAAIDRKVASIIREAEKQIKIPALAEAARRSLLRFYDSQYRELRRSFGWQLATLSAIFLLQGRTLSGREIKPTAAQKAQAVQTLMRHGYTPPRAAVSYTHLDVYKRQGELHGHCDRQEAHDDGTAARAVG